MAVAAPRAVAEAAHRRGLGALRDRYPFRTILLAPAAVTGLMTVGMLAGGYWFAAVFGLLTLALVLWDVFTRRNRAVYLHEGGVVYVNIRGEVAAVARWRDIADVRGMNVNVHGPGPTIKRRDYLVVLADGGIDFNTIVMRGADDLAERIERRRYETKQAGLNAGETVAFGQFTVSPDALTFTPPVYRDQPPPSGPATVPWSDVTGARVERRDIDRAGPVDHVVVGVADHRAELATLITGVTDLELFVAVVNGRAGRS